MLGVVADRRLSRTFWSPGRTYIYHPTRTPSNIYEGPAPEIEDMAGNNYCELIGSLQYVSLATRPDVTFSVSNSLNSSRILIAYIPKPPYVPFVT